MNSHQLRVTPSITMSPEDNEKGRPLFPGGLKATVKVQLEWPQSVSRLRGRWGEVPADLASQETLKQFLLFIKKLQKAGLCTAPEVFAQQSCEILRVCHVQRTSKMLRISDVSWLVGPGPPS